MQRRASMAARSEAYQLVRVSQVGAALIIFLFQPSQIHQQLFWGRLACKWGNWHVSILLLTNGYWETGHAFAFQMSAAYSAIVRSLENFPEPATFRIALRDHAERSPYSSQSRRSASRYGIRSARCM